MQAADGVVAVPIYGSDDFSEVQFFDVSGGTCVRLGGATLRKSDMQAKAVGLVRLARDGEYVLAVWDDKRLDFHVSRTRRLSDGFPHHCTYQLEGRALPEHFFPPFPGGTYQSINLVRDGRDDSLYLIGTRNSSKTSIVFGGRDYADLYSVCWPPPRDEPTLRLVERKQMYCYDQQCNFGAAVGIYTEEQRHLWIYAAAHWLHGGNSRFNFNEYSYLCTANCP